MQIEAIGRQQTMADLVGGEYVGGDRIVSVGSD